MIGLITSCSKNKNNAYDHPTIQQLMSIQKINFDSADGVRHYITKDYDEAKEWRHKEMAEDRIVSGRLNKETGEYIYKSISKEKVTLPTVDKVLNLVDENGEFTLEDEE